MAVPVPPPVPSPAGSPGGAPPPKLLDRVRAAARLRQYRVTDRSTNQDRLSSRERRASTMRKAKLAGWGGSVLAVLGVLSAPAAASAQGPTTTIQSARSDLHLD